MINLKIIFIFLIALSVTASAFAFDTLSNPANESKAEVLSLRLLGTIIEGDKQESIAVIQEAGSEKQLVLRITDKIRDYQIVKIMRGKVTLLKSGKLYTLDFPLGGEFLEPITIVSPETRIIHRDCLIEKISDLNFVMQLAVPIPHIVSGKIAGFKITKIKDKAMAQMAGIKDGDIITSINGEKISSIKSALDIYSRTKGMEKINLEIKRDNTIKNLTYYIN